MLLLIIIIITIIIIFIYLMESNFNIAVIITWLIALITMIFYSVGKSKWITNVFKRISEKIKFPLP